MEGAPADLEPMYRTLSPADYPGIRGLLLADSPDLSESDSEERISAFLDRNRDYCFGALVGDRLVGMIMCGCDGRSARIYHLIVVPEWRRKGVAHTLIGRAYGALKDEGIGVMDVIVFREAPGAEFWDSEGFRDRSDLAYRDFAIDDI